jgi:hypothetical protein
LHEEQPHVDEGQHLGIALGQWVEAQAEELRARGLARYDLFVTVLGVLIVEERRLDFGASTGSRPPQAESSQQVQSTTVKRTS